jgi:hypothetical protein
LVTIIFNLIFGQIRTAWRASDVAPWFDLMHNTQAGHQRQRTTSANSTRFAHMYSSYEVVRRRTCLSELLLRLHNVRLLSRGSPLPGSSNTPPSSRQKLTVVLKLTENRVEVRGPLRQLRLWQQHKTKSLWKWIWLMPFGVQIMHRFTPKVTSSQ